MGDLGDWKKPSTEELLDAQAHLWNHIYSFINPMSLKCAIELGIPDIVHKHGKPMTISQLTKALNINESKSRHVFSLMHVLVHEKFFTKAKISKDEEDDEMGFMVSPAYRPLLIRDHDLSMVSFIDAVLDSVFINPFHSMSRWFQNEDPTTPFMTCHGKTFWEYLGLNPRLGLLFNQAMASDSSLVSRIVLLSKDCTRVFQGLESVVDVGGGTGDMVKALCQEFSTLKCSVLDLPQVVDGLKGNDKVTFIGGSMFEYIPPCDAVLLKSILHDWSDGDCLRILRKCKEAIIPSKGKGGSKVIIIDMVVVSSEEEDDQKARETQLLSDMLMMVLVCGKERSEKDWGKLFSEAGFTSYKITPLLGLRSLIEVFP